jgi:hypothetical protein
MSDTTTLTPAVTWSGWVCTQLVTAFALRSSTMSATNRQATSQMAVTQLVRRSRFPA